MMQNIHNAGLSLDRVQDRGLNVEEAQLAGRASFQDLPYRFSLSD